MRYLVFEAGGRAGLSAELFFRSRREPSADDTLLLADMDPTYFQCPSPKGVRRLDEREVLALIAEDSSDMVVFPADELARQGKESVFNLCRNNPFTAVDKWFFDKKKMNENLSVATKGCAIAIPQTFELSDVFMRPDTMSAGSHGVGRLSNICITQYVEIEHEYVVDVDFTSNMPVVYPREVKIKNGYDRYLKFLPRDGKVGGAVQEFVLALRAAYPMMVTGIFHIQLIENKEGKLFFVEYSKRISGTSIVNLQRGYNPFDSFAGLGPAPASPQCAPEGTWFRYEDMMGRVFEVMAGR